MIKSATCITITFVPNRNRAVGGEELSTFDPLLLPTHAKIDMHVAKKYVICFKNRFRIRVNCTTLTCKSINITYIQVITILNDGSGVTALPCSIQEEDGITSRLVSKLVYVNQNAYLSRIPESLVYNIGAPHVILKIYRVYPYTIYRPEGRNFQRGVCSIRQGVWGPLKAHRSPWVFGAKSCNVAISRHFIQTFGKPRFPLLIFKDFHQILHKLRL